MLIFSDVSKTKEIRETLPAEGYKDIKPAENLNREDAINFWKGEFSQKEETPVEDIYEKLLSEIYNRTEEEIDIDFDLDDSILEYLDKIISSEWKGISDPDMLDVMEQLVDVVAEKLDLKSIPGLDVYEESNSTYGDYNPILNVISINKQNCDNSIDLVDTLMHELRHAYQNERAEVLETWQDALYRCNFDNYISPVQLPNGTWLFATDYYDQYVEVDARAFANKFTEAMG